MEGFLRENFAKWLEKQPEDRIFTSTAVASCPLAEFATSLGSHHGIVVGVTTYAGFPLSDARCLSVRTRWGMPDWASRFVDTFDPSLQPTKKELLTLLKRHHVC